MYVTFSKKKVSTYPVLLCHPLFSPNAIQTMQVAFEEYILALYSIIYTVKT